MRKTELHSVLSAPDGIPRNEGLMKTDSPVHPVILSKRSHLLEMTLPFSPLGACEVFFCKIIRGKIIFRTLEVSICVICDSKRSGEGLARSDGNEVANLRITLTLPSSLFQGLELAPLRFLCYLYVNEKAHHQSRNQPVADEPL